MHKQNSRLTQAAVNGRFQPLHKGHLRYILEAKNQCDFLWVGVTQPIISALEASPADTHREERSNNPFTYFERYSIVRRALIAAGVPEDQFGIVPFPIDNPRLLREFLSTEIPIFTTICEEWNRFKIETIRDAGFEVRVLWEEDHKEYTGTDVRLSLKEGSNRWMDMVPESVIPIIQDLNIGERLTKGA